MSMCTTLRVLPKSLALAATVLMLSGCGEGGYAGPTGKAGGKVTYNAQPLPAGSIVTFISTEGHVATGTTSEDGSFKLVSEGSENIPAATYKVQLSPPPAPESDQFMDPSQPMPEAAPQPFPSKYAASSTSGLQYVVQEGENAPIVIELQ